MPTPVQPAQDDLLIENIRRAVREHVAATSLRSMARELGASPSGLSKFLDGAHPYRKRFLRLKAWYARNQHEPMQLSDGDARAALTLLTAGMEKERRDVATEAIIEALTAGFADNPPTWLHGLRTVWSERHAEA
jgi:hypothetical protein